MTHNFQLMISLSLLALCSAGPAPANAAPAETHQSTIFICPQPYRQILVRSLARTWHSGKGPVVDIFIAPASSTVHRVELRKSSGNKQLDQQALNFLRDAPIPALPRIYNGNDIAVSLDMAKLSIEQYTPGVITPTPAIARYQPGFGYIKKPSHESQNYNKYDEERAWTWSNKHHPTVGPTVTSQFLEGKRNQLDGYDAILSRPVRR